LLASLKEGGSFVLEQDRVNNEIWLPTRADINLGVKVLLVKGINVNSAVTYGNYKRFNVDAEKEKLKDPIVTPVVARAVVSRPPAQPTAREEPSHNDLIEAAATPRPPEPLDRLRAEGMLADVRFRTLAPALALAIALACRQEPDAPAVEPSAPAETVAAAAPSEPAPAAKPAPKRQERPLPAISGWTLDDKRFDVSSLLGKRLLLFFFNPEVREAPIVARAIAGIAPLAAKHNFQIYGIATGSNRARAAEFAKQAGLAFPIVDDSSAAIAQQLGMRIPVACSASTPRAT
jgi:peroxiredoxin